MADKDLENIIENLQLNQLSLSRMLENQEAISLNEFFENNGISEEYLNSLPDIEIE